MGITANQEGPLLELLTAIAPDSSKTTLRSWIKEGRVTVDGKIVKKGDLPIAKGQKIALESKPRYTKTRLRILYDDDDLVVIDKPEGLLSVSTAFDKTNTAYTLLKAHYHPRKVRIVHRLDQETSGVMLFALSEKGCHGLKKLFEKHDIKRTYCAVVEGKVIPSKGTWRSYLYEDSRYVVHSTEDPEKGVLAVTHYKADRISSRFSQLTLTLETGRKNQIRVHCQQAGHPIAGDKKYGAATHPLKRLCLHAASLEFIHPVTGKAMRFSSPVPESFHRLFLSDRGRSHA